MGGIRTRNKNRQTVTNLELQGQTQASTEESNIMPPPSIPVNNAPSSNGSENIPPKRGQVDADTVGKAAGGVSKYWILGTISVNSFNCYVNKDRFFS